ncbi:hypothetical protein CLOSTMETH_03861 [[Clostridium] methylpentosum DSM 5476]|uniref:Uncharacterized protein n=1 Tax=[Clostridium] methylpentosum DSM 5476 TaxID=537013 RepID=C0EJ15_9FIRM|nr:hypothetical protein CLOSTMETH_03861 [[Clostridium] methylpentosum DSM 5476]
MQSPDGCAVAADSTLNCNNPVNVYLLTEFGMSLSFLQKKLSERFLTSHPIARRKA